MLQRHLFLLYIWKFLIFFLPFWNIHHIYFLWSHLWSLSFNFMFSPLTLMDVRFHIVYSVAVPCLLYQISQLLISWPTILSDHNIHIVCISVSLQEELSAAHQTEVSATQKLLELYEQQKQQEEVERTTSWCRTTSKLHQKLTLCT